MGFWSDVGDALSSAASSAGDFVQDVGTAVVDTAEDVGDTIVDGAQSGISAAAEWVCKEDGSVGCGAANVIGGIIDGGLQGLQDIGHAFCDLARDGLGLAGSLLRLDFPGLLKGLGTLFLDGLTLLVDLGRFFMLGYFVGGVVRYFKRSE